MNVDEKVNRAALLILLREGGRQRSEIVAEFNNIDEIVSGIEDELELKFRSEQNTIELEENISFNLFQDVPPEVRSRVRNKVTTVDPNFYSYTSTTEQKMIADLSRSEIDPKDIKDFRPYPPLPMRWEGREEVPRGKDMYASRVCPENTLQLREDGKMLIQDPKAPGLLLAAIKDPFNTLKFTEELEFEFKRYDIDDSKIHWVEGDEQTRREITSRNLESYEQPRRRLSFSQINSILDTFERRTGRSERRWDQVPYYLFTRNCLRLLGMDARYTGAPGMKTKSDVTTYSPIYVTIEVKSPAESKINEKAVRQAFDSSVPFDAELDEDVYRAAVGADISNDAVSQTNMYERAHDIKTPLITGRVLLFLVLMSSHVSLDTEDLEFLFGDLSGAVTANNIAELYRRHFKRNGRSDVESYIQGVEKCLE